MNVIVFFTDQQRWDTLGLNGNPMGLTPNLDRLARQGTFFSEAITPQPVCGPARSCIQTGQYATTTGVYKNGPGLGKSSPKLADCFRKAGYRTGYIGKWHLSEGTGPGAVPKNRRGGYEDWLAANCVELVSGPYSAQLWDEADEAVQLPGYRSDAMVDAAIRYIDKRAQSPDEPYLLFLSFLEPHHQNTDDSYPAPHGMETDYLGGWLPPDLQALGGSSAQQWAGYCAMVKRLDDGLGRLMDAVESLGQAEETLVAFISDHGCHFKTRNAEYKRSPHESSVRIPFAIWGPGWNGGGQHRCPASLVDLAPSLLESAGIQIPKAMEGRSLLPVTRGEGLKSRDDTFIQFGDGFLPPGRAVRTSRWKYAVQSAKRYTGKPGAPSYSESELYDLQADPYELTNLIHHQAYAPVRTDMRNRLKSWLARTGEKSARVRKAKASQAKGQRMVDYPNSR